MLRILGQRKNGKNYDEKALLRLNFAKFLIYTL